MGFLKLGYRIGWALPLGVVVLVVGLTLATLVASPPSAFGTGTGSSEDCAEPYITIQDGGEGDTNSDSNTIAYTTSSEGITVSGVCVGYGDVHTGLLNANDTYGEGCLEISGIGTASVTVTAPNDRENCGPLDHIDVYVSDDVATPTPTPEPEPCFYPPPADVIAGNGGNSRHLQRPLGAGRFVTVRCL